MYYLVPRRQDLELNRKCFETAREETKVISVPPGQCTGGRVWSGGAHLTHVLPADGYGQRGRHLPKEVSRLASDVSSLEVGANTNSRGGVGVATCGVKSKNTVQR